MTGDQYQVQCMLGHVMEVIPGSELEQTCKERTQLDALCIDSVDCLVCIDMWRARAELDFQYGCPMAGLDGCDEDCPCKERIHDSKYVGQLRHASAYV